MMAIIFSCFAEKEEKEKEKEWNSARQHEISKEIAMKMLAKKGEKYIKSCVTF